MNYTKKDMIDFGMFLADLLGYEPDKQAVIDCYEEWIKND